MKWITDSSKPQDNEWVNVAIKNVRGRIVTTYGIYGGLYNKGWALFNGFEEDAWRPEDSEVLGWHSLLPTEALPDTENSHSHIVNPEN